MAGARDTSETGDTRDTRDIAAAAGTAVGAVLVLHVSPLSGMSLGTALLAVAATGAVMAARRPAPWRAFPGKKS